MTTYRNKNNPKIAFLVLIWLCFFLPSYSMEPDELSTFKQQGVKTDNHGELLERVNKFLLKSSPSRFAKLYGDLFKDFPSLEDTMPKALKSEGQLLEGNIEELYFYLHIFWEYAQQKGLSATTIDTLNNKIDDAMLLFTTTIKSGPNFAVAEPFWDDLQLEVLDIKSSRLVNVISIHIIGAKLCLLSDLSRITSTQASQEFLLSKTTRIDRLCGRYAKNNNTVRDFLALHLVDNFGKFEFTGLSKIVPIIKPDGLFGMQTFLHAASLKLSLLAYSPTGSAKAHGGLKRSFLADNRWSNANPEECFTSLDREDFDSSCMLLSHDWEHIDVYSHIFKKDLPFYVDLISLATKKFLKKRDNLLDFAFLMIVMHEMGFTFGNSNMISNAFDFNSESRRTTIRRGQCKNELDFCICSFFPSFDTIISCLDKKFHVTHMEALWSSKRFRAVFQFADIVELLKVCGADITLDPKQVCNAGPKIKKILRDYLRTSKIGRKMSNHSNPIRNQGY